MKALIDFLNDKFSWSLRTFGDGQRHEGVCRHIEKELIEIREKPDDLIEWIDVILLGFDGAMRQGFTADQVVAAMIEKDRINQAREWPEPQGQDVPTEHIREPKPINRAYNDAYEWLDNARRSHGLKPVSEFGRVVAWILNRGLGIGLYDALSKKGITTVEWRNLDFVTVTLSPAGSNRLATFDFDGLTRLVVMCHETAVRMEIDHIGLGYARLRFHERGSREGSMSKRHPSLEDAAHAVRKTLRKPDEEPYRPKTIEPGECST